MDRGVCAHRSQTGIIPVFWKLVYNCRKNIITPCTVARYKSAVSPRSVIFNCQQSSQTVADFYSNRFHGVNADQQQSIDHVRQSKCISHISFTLAPRPRPPPPPPRFRCRQRFRVLVPDDCSFGETLKKMPSSAH